MEILHSESWNMIFYFQRVHYSSWWWAWAAQQQSHITQKHYDNQTVITEYIMYTAVVRDFFPVILYDTPLDVLWHEDIVEEKSVPRSNST